MTNYNLYFKNSKINNNPISEIELSKIKENSYIGKLHPITKTIEKIPIEEIKIVKCYTV